MYSKNVMLVLCVSSYFVQCQCVYPTQAILNIIYNVVAEYARPEGLEMVGSSEPARNLVGVRDIIEQVGERLNIRNRVPSLQDLEKTGFDYVFTITEVERFVTKLMQYEKEGLPEQYVWMVNIQFSSFDKPNGISFQDLKELLNHIQTAYGAHPKPDIMYLNEAKTAIPYKTSICDYRYTREEVELIVIHHFFRDYFRAILLIKS